MTRTALRVAIVLFSIGLALLSMVGCSAGVGLRINHAPRCEVQVVNMFWIDGSVDSMVLNSCRFGAVGRFPSEDHK